jgi:nucleoside-diphosphate-sugar epimerase
MRILILGATGQVGQALTQGLSHTEIDHVIYGIGLPEQFLFDNSVFDRVNCQLLRTFLEALRSSGVRRLTYISTYEVFEVIDNEIDETHPVAPTKAR